MTLTPLPTFTAAVVIAIATLSGAATGDPCAPVRVGTSVPHGEAIAAALVDQGWHGKAADGIEALYRPGC